MQRKEGLFCFIAKAYSWFCGDGTGASQYILPAVTCLQVQTKLCWWGFSPELASGQGKKYARQQPDYHITFISEKLYIKMPVFGQKVKLWNRKHTRTLVLIQPKGICFIDSVSC